MPDNASSDLTRFERVVNVVSWIGAALAAIVIIITLLTVGFSVFKRYVLGTPVTWTDELSGFLVVAMVMLGAAETLRHGDHISVDLITSRLHGRLRQWQRIWSFVAVMTFSAAIFYSAVLMVRFSYNFGIYSEGYLEAPMWIPQAVLLVGALMLFVVALTATVVVLLRR